MRITAQIVSSGESWKPIFPPIKDMSVAFPCVDGIEHYDEEEGLKLLKHDRIMHSERDNKLVQCVAVILIDAVNRWMDDNEVINERTKSLMPRFDRKAKQGKISYCRICLSPATIVKDGKQRATVKISVNYDDNGQVSVHPFEKYFAWIIADIVIQMSKKFEAQGDMPLVFDENINALSREMHEWIAEQERIEEIHRRNGERLFCKNYCHGACSPSQFNCPNYKNGQCVEISNESGVF